MRTLLVATAAALCAAVLGAQTPVKLAVDIGQSPYIRSLGMHDGYAWFTAEDANGARVYRTDGTQAGTILASPNHSPAQFVYYYAASALGELYYLVRVDGTDQLWRTDGTAAGAAFVQSAPVVSFPDWSSLSGVVEFDGHIYFWVLQSSVGAQLYRSNGTPAGTASVGLPTQNTSFPPSLAAFGNQLLLSLDGPNGVELYASDGTAAGTYELKNIDPSGGSFPLLLIDYNGHFYFLADDPVNGTALWKTDGTTGGTVMVKDMHPGGPSWILRIVVHNGYLFFAAAGDPQGGAVAYDLWRTDGTGAGTIQLSNSPNPLWSFSTLGNLLYTASAGLAAGGELRSTDGTVAGTSIRSPLPAGHWPASMAAHHSMIYLNIQSQSTNKFTLWRFNPLDGNLVPFYDFYPAQASGGLGSFIGAAGQRLIMTVDGPSGGELWVLETSGTGPGGGGSGGKNGGKNGGSSGCSGGRQGSPMFVLLALLASLGGLSWLARAEAKRCNPS